MSKNAKEYLPHTKRPTGTGHHYISINHPWWCQKKSRFFFCQWWLVNQNTIYCCKFVSSVQYVRLWHCLGVQPFFLRVLLSWKCLAVFRIVQLVTCSQLNTYKSATLSKKIQKKTGLSMETHRPYHTGLFLSQLHSTVHRHVTPRSVSGSFSHAFPGDPLTGGGGEEENASALFLHTVIYKVNTLYILGEDVILLQSSSKKNKTFLNILIRLFYSALEEFLTTVSVAYQRARKMEKFVSFHECPNSLPHRFCSFLAFVHGKSSRKMSMVGVCLQTNGRNF